MNEKPCNCEFCIKCDSCGHSADSHVAGNGNCMMKGCECASHHSWVISIWERMSQSQRDDYDSFTQFADRMMEAKNMIVSILNDEPIESDRESDARFEHQSVLEDFQDDIIH